MRFPFISRVQNSQGFSLVETLVVLAIIAGVLGFAVPGWQKQIIAKEVDTASGQLFRDLQLARVESIRRGVPVVLCPSEGDETCRSDGDWGNGWIGFEDHDGDQTYDSTESILLVGPAFARVSINWRNPNWLRFMPQGEAWPNGHFRVCDKSHSRTHSVIVYRTGRARLGKKSPSGAPILCGKGSRTRRDP